MSFEEARKQLSSGRRMSPREYQFLSSFVDGGICVDIGAWMGFSTRAIVSSFKREGIVLAIDPHSLDCAGKHRAAVEKLGLSSTRPFLEANLAEWGIASRVVVIEGRSQDIGRELDLRVDLLVVDGSHRYADVVEDIEVWVPKVRGYALFHDYQHIPGATKAVDELMMPHYKLVGKQGWLVAFECKGEVALSFDEYLKALNRVVMSTKRTAFHTQEAARQAEIASVQALLVSYHALRGLEPCKLD